MKIYPRCKLDFKQIYVTSEGYVFPCSWVGNMPYKKDFLDFFKDDIEKLSLKNSPSKDILETVFSRLTPSWNNPVTCPSACREFCSKPPPDSKKYLNGTTDTVRIDLKK